MKLDLKSMTQQEMAQAFSAMGEPSFRAKQVFTWLHKGAVSFDEMTKKLLRNMTYFLIYDSIKYAFFY